MSEFENTPRSYSGALLAALAVSLVLGVSGLVWSYVLSGRISTQQTELDDARQQNTKVAAQLREAEVRLKVANEELGQSLGLSQKQLDAKAQEIMRRENAQEVNSQRLEAVQKQTAEQVSSVSHEVSNVKSDVGGVKNDVAKTQSDLSNALSKLQTMQGDLDGHSGLIARNHDELEILKHKGDRTYYEFTINKGQRKPVGTISLELKKTDAKKSKITLNIYADDKTYEKKDRNLNEPLQLYAGQSRMLYEVVVNSIDNKNQITGYLAVPKNAPAPVQMH